MNTNEINFSYLIYLEFEIKKYELKSFRDIRVLINMPTKMT